MELQFDLKLTGLDRLKPDMEKKVRKVLWLSMNKIDEIATRLAPVDTGRLRNSIHIYPMREGEKSYIVADGVEYGVYVEFGTSPHIIRPRIKKALSWIDDTNKRVFAKKVNHPGTNAHPFFRPALKEVRDAWVQYYTNKVFNKP